RQPFLHLSISIKPLPPSASSSLFLSPPPSLSQLSLSATKPGSRPYSGRVAVHEPFLCAASLLLSFGCCFWRRVACTPPSCRFNISRSASRLVCASSSFSLFVLHCFVTATPTDSPPAAI